MLTFITIASLAVAAIVILNLLSVAGPKASTAPGMELRDGVPGGAATLKVLQIKDQPRPRICPVCGKALSSHEYLIAAIEPETQNGRKRQAQIYGCPHCYVNGGVNLEQLDL